MSPEETTNETAETTPAPATTTEETSVEAPAVGRKSEAHVEKSDEQVEAAEKAKAAKSAPALEMKFQVGEKVEIKGVPFEVVKRDGMTIRLRRTDIVG